jgi:hypothetical protein
MAVTSGSLAAEGGARDAIGISARKPITSINHLRDASCNFRTAQIRWTACLRLDQQSFIQHIQNFIHHQAQWVVTVGQHKHGLAAGFWGLPMRAHGQQGHGLAAMCNKWRSACKLDALNRYILKPRHLPKRHCLQYLITGAEKQ